MQWAPTRVHADTCTGFASVSDVDPAATRSPICACRRCRRQRETHVHWELPGMCVSENLLVPKHAVHSEHAPWRRCRCHISELKPRNAAMASRINLVAIRRDVFRQCTRHSAPFVSRGKEVFHARAGRAGRAHVRHHLHPRTMCAEEKVAELMFCGVPADLATARTPAQPRSLVASALTIARLRSRPWSVAGFCSYIALRQPEAI